MVLGILTAIAACPAIIGTTEAVRQGQRQNAKERHRGQKSNLIASCPSATTKVAKQLAQLIEGSMVVLRDHKLYIDVPPLDELEFDDPPPAGHPFAGYFLQHPEHQWGWKGEGMVSTIMDEPPQLNWIYVDEETNEVKYGNKIESAGGLMGPWNCTKVDRRMTFDGWEGFIAVQERPDVWALYFDVADDGLRGKVHKKRMVEVELTRKERRKTKENADDKDYQ